MGNVGKSQMAEVLFNKQIEGKHVAHSAGTLVYNKDRESMQGQKLKDHEGSDGIIVSSKEINSLQKYLAVQIK